MHIIKSAQKHKYRNIKINKQTKEYNIIIIRRRNLCIGNIPLYVQVIKIATEKLRLILKLEMKCSTNFIGTNAIKPEFRVC
jgi:hypothetical protein